MSYYTREQALEMVLQDDLDSGGEIDIEEDPDFPLPHSSDSDEPGDNSDSRRPSPDHGPGDSHNSDSDLDEANPVHYRSLATRTATKENHSLLST